MLSSVDNRHLGVPDVLAQSQRVDGRKVRIPLSPQREGWRCDPAVFLRQHRERSLISGTHADDEPPNLVTAKAVPEVLHHRLVDPVRSRKEGPQGTAEDEARAAAQEKLIEPEAPQEGNFPGCARVRHCRRDPVTIRWETRCGYRAAAISAG